MATFILRALLLSSVCLAIPVAGQSPQLAQAPKISIGSVRFVNASLLTQKERLRVSERLRHDAPESKDLTSVRALAWNLVRQAYDNRGFWQASLDVEVDSVRHEMSSGKVDVTIRVLEQGPKSRLRDIRWSGLTVYSETEVRSVVPISAGEIVRRYEITNGLESLRKLYWAKGYINFTSIPELDVDRNNGDLIISFELDEGEQFRIGNLSVGGLDGEHAKLLMTAWDKIRGQPYSMAKIDEAFGTVFHPVPQDLPTELYTRRNVDEENHTVNLSITFVPPPPEIAER